MGRRYPERERARQDGGRRLSVFRTSFTPEDDARRRDARPATTGPRSRASAALRAPTILLLVAATAACSPALDWREVPVPDSTLVARFPCRPARQQRPARVAGQELPWTLLACEQAGVTYGVATADVSDPARVDPVLEALADAARAGIDAPAAAPAAFAPPGVTPYRGNARFRFVGRRADGGTVEQDVAVFARGTRVFRASAIGSTLPEPAVAPFREGLQFRMP